MSVPAQTSLLEVAIERPVLRVEQADAVAFLQARSPGSIDLIVTDYAYESLEKHRAVGTTTRLAASWFEIFRNDRLPALLQAMHRAMARDSHLYMLCDQDTMHVLHGLNREMQLFTWWKFLVWDKQTIGMGYHWRARHEVICFLEKGKRKLNNLGWPDVLSFKAVRGGYPTEKNVDLLRMLIENSSAPGEVVCDPFCGSGSCGEAALTLGRRFIGCDLSADAASAAFDRCEPFAWEQSV